MKTVFFASLLVVLSAGLSAQTPPQTPPPTLQTAQPYTDAEFQPWMLDLRRAEIIAIGAFPLTYVFAGLGYDYYYYLSQGYPKDNIPWPVGPGTSRWAAPNQKDELQKKNLTLVGISLATGILLAAADWWLGQ